MNVKCDFKVENIPTAHYKEKIDDNDWTEKKIKQTNKKTRDHGLDL